MKNSIGIGQPLLDQRQTFSQSLLRDLQRRYFAEAGADVWRRGEVSPDEAKNEPLRVPPARVDP